MPPIEGTNRFKTSGPEGVRSSGTRQRVPPNLPIVTKHSKAETQNVVLVLGEDRNRDRSRSERRSRPADACRVCGKQVIRALKAAEGAQGPIRVSCRGLPCLRCPDSHETRGPYPNFEATLLDGVHDGIPKSKSRMPCASGQLRMYGLPCHARRLQSRFGAFPIPTSTRRRPR